MSAADPTVDPIPTTCQRVSGEWLRRELDLRSWTVADLSRATGCFGAYDPSTYEPLRPAVPPVNPDTLGLLMRRGWGRRDVVRRVNLAFDRNPPLDVAERLVG